MTTSQNGSLIITAALLALFAVPVMDPETGKQATTKDGPKTRRLKPAEVLSWRYTGDRVVVVTTDGQKYSADVPAELAAKLAKEGEAGAQA